MTATTLAAGDSLVGPIIIFLLVMILIVLIGGSKHKRDRGDK